jgi:hypothetical protein
VIYGYFWRIAIGGISGIVRNCRDNNLALQVLHGDGRVGEGVRFAAASALACCDLDFDCGWVDVCRGDYIPEPIVTLELSGQQSRPCSA